jgi:glutamate racemase
VRERNYSVYNSHPLPPEFTLSAVEGADSPSGRGRKGRERTSITDPRPIGIFDSGIGGLTVLRAIHDLLPCEPIVYLGDTARVPYGTKSRETIIRYSVNNARFLLGEGVKMIVVACNTASAYALEDVARLTDNPVVGVVEGGVVAALKNVSGAIGVIGTEATIRSNKYPAEINRLQPGIKVISKACPLFVALAEEGWTGNEVAHAVAKEYLSEFKGKIDALVLGCTHYPPLKGVIQLVLGENVRLIDSAEETARIVGERLDNLDMRAGGAQRGKITMAVTDSPERSLEVGRRLLGRDLEISGVTLVDIT